MHIPCRRPAVAAALAVLSVFLWVSACGPVQLVSYYDEPTDAALTALQQSADDFIAGLIDSAPSPGNAFENHVQFYEDADQQIRRLEFRVASIPNNDHTIKLVADIRAVILGEGKCSEDGGSLRDLHCLPDNLAQGPSRTALEISRRNINQAIGAALGLELAKKQGLEQN